MTNIYSNPNNLFLKGAPWRSKTMGDSWSTRRNPRWSTSLMWRGKIVQGTSHWKKKTKNLWASVRTCVRTTWGTLTYVVPKALPRHMKSMALRSVESLYFWTALLVIPSYRGSFYRLAQYLHLSSFCRNLCNIYLLETRETKVIKWGIARKLSFPTR